MEREKLKRLLKEYQAGAISKDELLSLLDYVARNENEPLLDQLLAELMEDMEEDTTLPIASERLYNSIVTHPEFETKPVKTIRRYSRWISTAAAILVIVGGFWLYQYQNNRPISEHGEYTVRTITSSPSDKLILKTSDGRVIDLDNFTSMETEGISAIHAADAEGLVYDNVENALSHEEHTIVTPKGRQYSITLSDGTKVWLNSASTITFPANFHGDIREITLDGEAYFEVKRASFWPFIVHTNTQKVEVLGTHFNINAYHEDKITYTSLLEGKISISTPNENTILHPGQQARNTASLSKLKIKNIDIKDVIAWRDNLLVFNNEEIQQAMRQISRWYDVEVVYLNGMEGKRIGGSIPRFENITELMDALQATGLLHYQMKGGTIIIRE